jgi:hypothetical protein
MGARNNWQCMAYRGSVDFSEPIPGSAISYFKELSLGLYTILTMTGVVLLNENHPYLFLFLFATLTITRDCMMAQKFQEYNADWLQVAFMAFAPGVFLMMALFECIPLVYLIVRLIDISYMWETVREDYYHKYNVPTKAKREAHFHLTFEVIVFTIIFYSPYLTKLI